MYNLIVFSKSIELDPPPPHQLMHLLLEAAHLHPLHLVLLLPQPHLVTPTPTLLRVNGGIPRPGETDAADPIHTWYDMSNITH